MATSARIDELRKKFDENPRRYFAPLANEYRKAGDPERAIAICEEYLPQQPGHMSGHIVYGQALFELGRFDEARGVFETALSLDPENLIALRHLGDIARQAGDAHAARVWYQRVLEADPRNEEIAQLMMSLLSTPANTAIVDHNAPTPLSNPAIPARPSSPTPAIATPAQTLDEQLATTQEVEAPRATNPSLTPVAPPSVAPPAPPPPMHTPVSPQSFVSRHAPKEEELLDLDSFDLGGVPLSTLRNAKSEAELEAEAAPEADSGAMADLEMPERSDTGRISRGDEAMQEDFDDTSFATSDVGAQSRLSDAFHEPVEIEKAQEFAEGFEQDSFAIAAKPLTEGEVGSLAEEPPGTIELAADIGLGLPDDGGSSSTFGDEQSLDGLETFEPGVLTAGTSEVTSAGVLETESFYDIDSVPGTVEADADDTFVEDSVAFTGASAFSQVRDDVPDVPSEAWPVQDDVQPDEPIAEAHEPPQLRTPQFGGESAIEEASPPPPPSLSALPELPPLATPKFHEAQPASPHGDPFLTPAFGFTAVTPHEETLNAWPVEPEAAHLDSTASTPLDTAATPDSAEGDAHVPTAEESGGASAFVTETMATLYLEQGHYDAALDIYRQLVQQRPDDIGLRDRLHAAEERAWGHHSELGTSILDESDVAPPTSDADLAAEEDAPAPRTYGGPTIRDFLTGVLFRRQTTNVEEAAPSEDVESHVFESQVADAHDQSESHGDEFSTDLAQADTAHVDGHEHVAHEHVAHETVAAPAEPPPTRTDATQSSGDTVTGSLGALFSGADAAGRSPRTSGAPDERIATPIGGTPAHRAPTELSLDHVFKANTGRSGSDPAFSFDQFFSGEASEPTPPAVEPANEARADSSDDIAQFNAWLNGLKKP